MRYLVDTNILIYLCNSKDGREYGVIRAELECAGYFIGGNDLRIAAQARSRGLTVITDNLREFSRVEGLNVEDWSV